MTKLEKRVIKLEAIVSELGKDAEIKKLKELIENQRQTIGNLQVQLLNEQTNRVRDEFEKERKISKIPSQY